MFFFVFRDFFCNFAFCMTRLDIVNTLNLVGQKLANPNVYVLTLYCPLILHLYVHSWFINEEYMFL